MFYVLNQAVNNHNGKPTGRKCSCGSLAGACSCCPPTHNGGTLIGCFDVTGRQIHNAASAEQCEGMTREAAKATVRAIPGPGSKTRMPEHSDAATAAGKALRSMSKGKLLSAARRHDEAAFAHMTAAEGHLFTSDSRGHRLNLDAADNHKAAAQAAREAAGAAGNPGTNGVPVESPTRNQSEQYAGASPRLLAALANGGRTNNARFDVQRVNADTFPQTSQQGTPSLAGSPGMHSFDDGDEDDPSDYQGLNDYGYWTPRAKMSPDDFLRFALSDDFLTEENRRRQGLDVPDTMGGYSDAPGNPFGTLVASQRYPVNNAAADVPVYVQNAMTNAQLAAAFPDGIEVGAPMQTMAVITNELRSQMVQNMGPKVVEQMFSAHIGSLNLENDPECQRTRELLNNASHK